MAYKSKADQQAWNKTPVEREKARLRTLDRRNKMRQFLRDYKAERGCLYCRENHPVCLQFHHRDPSTKLFDIATNKSRRVADIHVEIAKCDIVCANCHAKEHERLRYGPA